MFNSTGGSPLCFPVIAFFITRTRQGQSKQYICCESLTVVNSSFKCHIIKSRLSWFPFENSSLGRRGSKRGGEEDTRAKMLMAGFVLVLPRFLLSGSLSTILIIHLLSLIQDIIAAFQMESELVKASDVISVTAGKVLTLTVLI